MFSTFRKSVPGSPRCANNLSSGPQPGLGGNGPFGGQGMGGQPATSPKNGTPGGQLPQAQLSRPGRSGAEVMSSQSMQQHQRSTNFGPAQPSASQVTYSGPIGGLVGQQQQQVASASVVGQQQQQHVQTAVSTMSVMAQWNMHMKR